MRGELMQKPWKAQWITGPGRPINRLAASSDLVNGIRRSAVCCIESAATGFYSVRITPHLGSIGSISGAMPHPYGKVAVDYKIQQETLRADVTLSPKTTGRVTSQEFRFLFRWILTSLYAKFPTFLGNGPLGLSFVPSPGFRLMVNDLIPVSLQLKRISTAKWLPLF